VTEEVPIEEALAEGHAEVLARGGAKSHMSEQDDDRGGLKGELRTIARGRASRTPFVAFLAVNLFLLVLAGVIPLIVLVVVWLL